MLVDSGAFDDEALENLPVPASVQALVGARLDALPEAERRLAQHAAVAGTVFWSSGAHQLVGGIHDPGPLLESLERRGFVHENRPSSIAGDREWEFKHVLIRDVAYGRLSKARRVGLHVRFANWIGGSPSARAEHVEILAYHLERACLLSRDVGHASTLRTSSAAASTSSITLPIAFSRSALSITGTPSTSARSTMKSWR